MRNYNRKRVGLGSIYAAIDTKLGLAKIGFSTNLYTTQANLARNWDIITSFEFDDAGIIDKKLAQILRSEKSIDYQSSKSYKLDSYRVQKVIKLLGGKVTYPTSKSYDICECSNCEEEVEVSYVSIMSLRRFIAIHESEILCDDCNPKVVINDLRKRLPKVDTPKKMRVWEHHREVQKDNTIAKDVIFYNECDTCGKLLENNTIGVCIDCWKLRRKRLNNV